MPTFEDAPESWRVWRNQRTRWMKGWIQTWLVHMREPVALWRDLGAKGFVGFQLLFFGMLASSVAHAFLLIFLACTVLAVEASGPPALVDAILLATDAFTLVAGYLAFVVLSTQALDREEKRVLPRHLWTLAVYWLLVSVAAFRAFFQLMDRPHVWEKTPHPLPSGHRVDTGTDAAPDRLLPANSAPLPRPSQRLRGEAFGEY